MQSLVIYVYNFILRIEMLLNDLFVPLLFTVCYSRYININIRAERLVIRMCQVQISTKPPDILTSVSS
jgi:hypothetical protein